jgi:peptide/nickel transport system substrate-binding protein
VWWSENENGTTEELTNYYHYDPDKARELIAAAGAEGAEIDLMVIGLQPVPALYEIVQNNLREVGLTPVGNVVETAAFDQGQTAGDLGAAFMQIHGLQGFSAATLVDALPALRDGNPSKFGPPRYRELKDALQAAQNSEAYAAALQELATFMLDEAFSHIIVHTNRLDAATSKVHGVVHVNVGYLELAGAWVSA